MITGYEAHSRQLKRRLFAETVTLQFIASVVRAEFRELEANETAISTAEKDAAA
jgi:hypothetical protein